MHDARTASHAKHSCCVAHVCNAWCHRTPHHAHVQGLVVDGHRGDAEGSYDTLLNVASLSAGGASALASGRSMATTVPHGTCSDSEFLWHERTLPSSTAPDSSAAFVGLLQGMGPGLMHLSPQAAAATTAYTAGGRANGSARPALLPSSGVTIIGGATKDWRSNSSVRRWRK